MEITAIEYNAKIAKIYQDFFPNDKVLVEDAHKYLLEHYEEFEFIWSSPPCPSHSRMRKSAMKFANGENIKAVYPDMKLYEEILLLEGYFEGKYVVENVISWYDPLIRPQVLGRHYFWTNFPLSNLKTRAGGIRYSFSGAVNHNHSEWQDSRSQRVGFDLSKYSGIDKEKILNNCVEPEIGKEIFDCAMKVKQKSL